jgi:formiminoglutamate deiminase
MSADPPLQRECRAWLCEYAFVGGRFEREVLVETAGDRIGAVTVDAGGHPAVAAERLPGLTVPGFANAHSHAFHRALRGRTQHGHGTFWTWREQMYAVAARLEPELYRDLATGVYAEMALAGITAVGEFHYVHHQPGGSAYQDPNAMGIALIEAARAAGIRVCLIDTCYLAGGVSTATGGVRLGAAQRRFSDGDAERWALRAEALHGAYEGAADVRIGAAIHSVRAVPDHQFAPVIEFASRYRTPLHAHVSEQRAENEACLAQHHLTPTELLAEHGALGPRTVAVHATHLSQADIELLAQYRVGVCACPSTERDLADGIGPLHALHAAGSPISFGSDSHAVIDPLEEARLTELHERLNTERRGHWRAGELLTAATAHGHAALGWHDAGRIAPGALADLVTIGLDSIRLAGTSAETAVESLVFAAGAADVRHVIAGGQVIVRDGTHQLIERPAARLDAALRALRG